MRLNELQEGVIAKRTVADLFNDPSIDLAVRDHESIDISDCFGRFHVHLTSLKGCPSRINGNFNCDDNLELTSLDGCPKHVAGYFSFTGCDKITSLQNIHLQIQTLGARTSPTANPWRRNFFRVPETIKSNVLGIFYIDGKFQVCDGNEAEYFPKWIVILFQHLQLKSRSIYDCQEELFSAGLDEYAQL